MSKKMMWVVVGVAVLAGAAAWGPIVSDVEQAKYAVAESHGAIEIRDYATAIVAEAEVSGERKEAINKGFRIIAAYIFGDNAPAQKVAMTAPVIQQPAQEAPQKIAMTAPVTQEGDGTRWKVRFVMPASYNLSSLPKPNNDAVLLKEIPGKRFAVVRFSGMAGEDSLEEQAEILQRFIAQKKLKALSEPVYAFFNPPWTLPFLRRNEVMVEIAR